MHFWCQSTIQFHVFFVTNLRILSHVLNKNLSIIFHLCHAKLDFFEVHGTEKIKMHVFLIHISFDVFQSVN